jgi:hypothetical protein
MLQNNDYHPNGGAADPVSNKCDEAHFKMIPGVMQSCTDHDSY